jgi:hypothetical protein
MPWWYSCLSPLWVAAFFVVAVAWWLVTRRSSSVLVRRILGGLAAISQICGVDGTEQFSGQHGSDSAPNSQLDSLKIGTLGTP